MKVQADKLRKIDAGDVLHVLLGGVISGFLAYLYSDGSLSVVVGVSCFVMSSSLFDLARSRRVSLEAFQVGFEAGVGVQTVVGVRPNDRVSGFISSQHGSVTFEREAAVSGTGSISGVVDVNPPDLPN